MQKQADLKKADAKSRVHVRSRALRQRDISLLQLLQGVCLWMLKLLLQRRHQPNYQ